MKPLAPVLLMVLLFVCSAAAQNKSVYTSSKTSACKTIESVPAEGGSYLGQCKGPGGYKIQLAEGDLRQTINIITPARKKHELEFWSFFGGFSSIGDTIEWRTKGGVPVALIARFNVAHAEDSTKNTSYLMVARVGKTKSCVTDIVEPGPKQNETARKLADAAFSKPCKPAQQAFLQEPR